MTGRDLIIYILANNLENEPVIKDGKLIGFSTVGEAAVKLDVGYATVLTRIHMGKLDHCAIDGGLYIPNTAIS